MDTSRVEIWTAHWRRIGDHISTCAYFVSAARMAHSTSGEEREGSCDTDTILLDTSPRSREDDAGVHEAVTQRTVSVTATLSDVRTDTSKP
jgi:hypothetical protein